MERGFDSDARNPQPQGAEISIYLKESPVLLSPAVEGQVLTPAMTEASLKHWKAEETERARLPQHSRSGVIPEAG